MTPGFEFSLTKNTIRLVDRPTQRSKALNLGAAIN